MKNPIPANAATQHAINVDAIRLPIFSTSTAFELLWSRAKDHLSLPECKWFAHGAASEVNNQTLRLAQVIEGIGMLVGADEQSGAFQDKDGFARLMFQLSTQVNAIAGLSSIAEQASFEVMDALGAAE